MSICPPSRPKASLATVMDYAKKAWADAGRQLPLPGCFVLAVRGYYRDTMGKPLTNDYGIYDDAIFLFTPFGFTAWNGNTDPSRIGWNPNADKFMARLQPGVWQMVRRMHRGKYPAFGQEGNPVTVDRVKADGTVAKSETGLFGIDLHKGGAGTSSEGCQTVPLEQWTDFFDQLASGLKATAQKSFPYILIEGPIN